MKTPLSFLLLFCSLFGSMTANGQASGRVVINEYMPWTSNGCGATAEFVELLNFGPGPINIGCYVITDGDFAVTIPPNTILQPGEFYLIAGQNIIPHPCANIDSTVTADLNWNTCGCTSAPITATGDGFFTDGGAANEQLVLLDPNKKVVDAVIRDLPTEPSSPITTSAVGGCTPLTFDLDTMNINYEVLGMSAGRGNSFARKLDGDCGWVKDPQQSGNATNNTPGESSNVSYNFTVVQTMDCDTTHGSIDVYVNVGSSTDVFPMEYVIAFDADNDNIFELTDTYTHGVDSTPPSIVIQGLPLGHYRVTVSSSKGCFLQTFEFRILECVAVLPVGVHHFTLQQTKTNNNFEWTVSGLENIQKITLEKSVAGTTFTTLLSIPTSSFSGTKHFTQTTPLQNGYYRLRLLHKNGQVSYSNIVSALPKVTTQLITNPVKDKLQVTYDDTGSHQISYQLYASSGALKTEGKQSSLQGTNLLTISVSHYAPGIYYLLLKKTPDAQPISFPFVKQ